MKTACFLLVALTASTTISVQAVSDSITKPKLRGELREIWERHVLENDASTPSMLEPHKDSSVDTTMKTLFTVGSTTPNGYTPPGIFDGMGAYKLDSNTVRALVNHELNHDKGYAYTVNDGALTMTGARVSYFDIDIDTLQVQNAGLAYDTVYDANQEPASNSNDTASGIGFLQGHDGFGRFCSGRLVNPAVLGEPFFPESGSGIVDRIYFAPEEDGGSYNGIGGVYWALDVEKNDFWSLAALGRGAWENLAPVDTGDSKTTGLIMTDDTSPFDYDGDGEVEAPPLYLYIGMKNPDGDFLERNGLAGGDLYVLVLDDGRTRPSQFSGTGFSTTARWVKIDNTRGEPDPSPIGETNIGYDAFGFPTQGNLWLKASSASSFGFSRPEDVHENPNDGTTVVVASTGVDTYDVLPSGDGSDSFGTLYSVTTDFSDMSIKLAILYDGDSDATRAIRSPDNLYWSKEGDICITEDKAEDDTLRGEPLFGENATNTDEAGIICIDAETGDLDHIAVVNRNVVYDTSLAEPMSAIDVDVSDAGAWEASGIIEVTDLFMPSEGRLFLLNVQAHGLEDQDQFGLGSRLHDADLVEGGQIILVSTVPREIEGEDAMAFNKAGLFGLLAVPFAIAAVYYACCAPQPSASDVVATKQEQFAKEEPAPVAQDPPKPSTPEIEEI